MKLSEMLGDWESRAVCGTYPTAWFFPERPSEGRGPWLSTSERIAKAICVSCPVRPDCLEAVMGWEHREGPQQGVWAGTLARERRTYTRLSLDQKRAALTALVESQYTALGHRRREEAS